MPVEGVWFDRLLRVCHDIRHFLYNSGESLQIFGQPRHRSDAGLVLKVDIAVDDAQHFDTSYLDPCGEAVELDFCLRTGQRVSAAVVMR